MALGCFGMTKKQRLILTIVISACFFVGELAIGFKTRSLALVAHFRQMNDLIGFIVALIAVIISERSTSPKALSFGWQRVQLLGGFFNGVFLIALGISIFLQSIERFVDLEHVEEPILVLIMGATGLGLNIITISGWLDHDHGHGHGHGHGHEHGHAHDDESAAENSEAKDSKPEGSEPTASRHHDHRHVDITFSGSGHDLGMLGVLIHVVGDAINNIGVIISAVVIWKAPGEGRFYADPAVSLFIALMIFGTALPLVKRAGTILLQSAPIDVNIDDVKHDLEKIPGIQSLHELHIWRLDERKTIASVHVVVSDKNMNNFIKTAKYINECLHAYGIHSTTLQPELVRPRMSEEGTLVSSASGADAISHTSIRRRSTQGSRAASEACQLICTGLCENLMCCNFK